MNDTKSLYVYDHGFGFSAIPAGKLIFNNIGGKESVLFEWDNDYMRELSSFCPALRNILISGEKYSVPLLSDSLPESFALKLIKEKHQNIYSYKDLFLSAGDYLRKGAFRFSEKEELYEEDSPESFIPCMDEIQDFADAFTKTETNCEHDSLLKDVIFKNGVSLGGSRQKLNFKDREGNIWIAKFPSVRDRSDEGASEYMLSKLAEKCGINVPDTELVRLQDGKSVFISRRFDRIENKRIHFFSAASLLKGKVTEKGSYLDIAEFICSYGSQIKENLRELYKRAVFTSLVNNTDNHLKNHGFMLTSDGFTLSPQYDVNPCPHHTGLSLPLRECVYMPDTEDLKDIAEYFMLKIKEAEEIIMFMKETLKTSFDLLAVKAGIGKDESERIKGVLNVKNF